MKTSTLLSASLAVLPSALAATDKFEAQANDGTRNLGWIHASDNSFWIGKPTASYCPSPPVPADQCPPGKKTLFESNDQSTTMSMDVLVPGGQIVFIDSTGAVRFTQAHSTFPMQPGDITTGWKNYHSNHGPPNQLSFNGKKLLACPESGKRNTAPFQIYVQLDGVNPPRNCKKVNVLTYPRTGLGAWQYT